MESTHPRGILFPVRIGLEPSHFGFAAAEAGLGWAVGQAGQRLSGAGSHFSQREY